MVLRACLQEHQDIAGLIHSVQNKFVNSFGTLVNKELDPIFELRWGCFCMIVENGDFDLISQNLNQILTLGTSEMDQSGFYAGEGCLRFFQDDAK
jgi:hypothetical protein